MLKKYLFSVVVITLLTSACFASIGQTASHTLITFCHPAIVGQSKIVYSFCYGSVGLGQQTCIVDCQHQVIHQFCWWPCEPQWDHSCNTPCEPQSSPTYTVTGGDATATAVSYCGNVDPTAQAFGGDATLEITSGPLCDPSCIVKGGNATATATSYDGAEAIAHAVGGDASVVIK